MSGLDRRLIEHALRHDLVTFVHKAFQTVSPGQAYMHNWHVDAMAHHLRLCLDRKIRRLIITVPPRNLKSICSSVAFPAFALGHDPTVRFICVSYAHDLMVKHSRDCRSVMQSPWYRQLFPRTRMDPRKNTEDQLVTTARGFRLGTSVGGTLTGLGGNFIIIDDPMKPADAMSEPRREAVKHWFDATLSSRLDDKRNDVIVIVMQRLHVDDLVGHVLGKDEWVHLNLPAVADTEQNIPIGFDRDHERRVGDLLHPEREPMEVLEALKGTMGSPAFSAQYLQAPVPAEGALIRWSWFNIYRDVPPRHTSGRIVQSWDTASKADELSDYSVCTTWLVQGNDCYLLDVFRKRLEYPYLKQKVIALARRHAVHTVLIEDKGSGTSLIQDLRRNGMPIIAINPEADKVTRMSAQSAKIESGQVHLPERATWLADFQTEIMQFPLGRHDDQVDSVSQLLGWLDVRSRNVRRMIRLRGF